MLKIALVLFKICFDMKKWYKQIIVLDSCKTYCCSPPEVFSIKVVLKICSKFTGEHPCFATLLKSLFGMGTLL